MLVLADISGYTNFLVVSLLPAASKFFHYEDRCECDGGAFT
jgi:hypothetical protein